MNETKKSVNTTETQKNKIYTPNFIRFGRFIIKDINSDTFFNCKKDSDIIAALKLYKYYTTKGGYIIGLFQNRLAEYIAKKLYPNVTPHLFDTCYSHYYNIAAVTINNNGKKCICSTNIKSVESVHLSKTVKIEPQGMISYLPFKPKKGDLTDEIAEIVVEFFTDKYTIGWALQKCRQTGDYHIKHINDYIALYKTQNNIKSTETAKKQDLFAENQDKGSGSNDIFKILYNVNKADIENKSADINKLERIYHHNNNVVHLFQHNYVEYESMKKAVEVYIYQGKAEKIRKEIISYLENATPEMVLKFNGLLEKGK